MDEQKRWTVTREDEGREGRRGKTGKRMRKRERGREDESQRVVGEVQ
jgi:hypothetical protein